MSNRNEQSYPFSGRLEVGAAAVCDGRREVMKARNAVRP
jgi:hypothetical protein